MIFEKIRNRLQEARNQLENSCLKVRSKEDCEKYTECGACIMDCAIDIINQAEAEYNNGWIPCSERLPNFDEDVLLYMNGYEMQMGYKDIQAFGEVVFYVYNSQDFVDLEDVIAWMPLPQPPKGE